MWWDRQIQTGRDYQTAIEEAIEAARCVLVLWSTASVNSDFVRAEADVGKERGVLLPVRLQEVRLPIAFRLLQAEDFTSWAGDVEADCWKRLILQIHGMSGLPPKDYRQETDEVPPPPSRGA